MPPFLVIVTSAFAIYFQKQGKRTTDPSTDEEQTSDVADSRVVPGLSLPDLLL